MKRPVATSRGLVGPRLAALAIIGLGLVALVGASQVRATATYVAVGPQVMPAVVGLALTILGGVLLLRTTIVPDLDLARHVVQEMDRSELRTPSLVMGALLVYAVLLGPLGYPLATSLFMPLGARILGSRRPGRDLLVAVVLGFAVYLGFTQLLGVRLPAGILEPVLP